MVVVKEDSVSVRLLMGLYPGEVSGVIRYRRSCCVEVSGPYVYVCVCVWLSRLSCETSICYGIPEMTNH